MTARTTRNPRPYEEVLLSLEALGGPASVDDVHQAVKENFPNVTRLDRALVARTLGAAADSHEYARRIKRISKGRYAHPGVLKALSSRSNLTTVPTGDRFNLTVRRAVQGKHPVYARLEELESTHPEVFERLAAAILAETEDLS